MRSDRNRPSWSGPVLLTGVVCASYYPAGLIQGQLGFSGSALRIFLMGILTIGGMLLVGLSVPLDEATRAAIAEAEREAFVRQEARCSCGSRRRDLALRCPACGHVQAPAVVIIALLFTLAVLVGVLFVIRHARSRAWASDRASSDSASVSCELSNWS